MSKVNTDFNDRPKDASIAQSGPCLPDDGSAALEATYQEIEQKRMKNEDGSRSKARKEIDEQVERLRRGSA